MVLQRFESLLLTPATILGTPPEAGGSQRPDRASHGMDCPRFVWQEIKRTRPRLRSGLRQLLIFYALPQQASLSQNAQWRSQKPFKPFAELGNLLLGHNTRDGKGSYSSTESL
jgi:hypothetical protein